MLTLKKVLKIMLKIVKESLNEFERGFEPKRALGIGKYANIDRDILSAYEALKERSINVDFPKPYSKELKLINRHNMSMTLEKSFSSIWALFVKHKDNNIPLSDLSFDDALDNIEHINYHWLQDFDDDNPFYSE